MRIFQAALLACMPLFLAVGCTSLPEYIQNGFKVGPNYRRPVAEVANEWIDSDNPNVAVGPGDYRNWWTVFRDPALDQLVVIAYQQNITLREAGFRVAEAQARRNVTAGNLFPQGQDLFGDYTRNQISQRTAAISQFPPGMALVNTSNWRIGGSLAWELDFWGRFRRSIEAADARLDASVENYDDALVLLIAEVSRAYVDLRTLELRLQVAHANAALQQESARIAQSRFNVQAVDSEVDAPQAKSNLNRTLATIEALEIAHQQTENRLCVLLGMPPQNLEQVLGRTANVPQAPEQVVIDLPASLLFRRPDVRRAERYVAAESAEIGVALSNLYPHISINGTMQLEAANFGQMFNGNAFAGAIGPAFRWDVLNYGRLINNVAAEEAQFLAQVAVYQQTVLQANEEAENAIVAFRFLHRQIKLLEASVREAEEAARVTQTKYAAGQIDFNRVFTVEQLLVQQQDQLANARGELALSLIDLYRALGGGWEIRLDPAMQQAPVPLFMPPAAVPQDLAPAEVLPPPAMEE